MIEAKWGLIDQKVILCYLHILKICHYIVKICHKSSLISNTPFTFDHKKNHSITLEFNNSLELEPYFVISIFWVNKWLQFSKRSSEFLIWFITYFKMVGNFPTIDTCFWHFPTQLCPHCMAQLDPIDHLFLQ